jgi:hypothetical protein
LFVLLVPGWIRAERSAVETEELQELLCSLKIVTVGTDTGGATSSDNKGGAVNADNMKE